MGSEGFVVTYEALIWICGLVITLGGATAVISRWLAPIKKLVERIDKLETRVNSDHDRLKDVETGNEKICKCVFALVNHELTGNSVDKMREARDEMQDYLIHK